MRKFKSQIIYSSVRVDTVLNSNKVHKWWKIGTEPISISISIRLFMLYLFKLDVHFLLNKLGKKPILTLKHTYSHTHTETH